MQAMKRSMRALGDPEGFWGEHGKRIDWLKPFTRVKNTSFDPHNVSIKWLRGRADERSPIIVSTGTCPHAPRRRRSSGRATIPTNPGISPTPSFTKRFSRLANVLIAHGVSKGDRVTIYLPMIPEAAYAMLACARIGAIQFHRVRRLFARLARRPNRGRKIGLS